MGIDGIGGKPPLGPNAGALGPSSPRGEEFSLERGGAAAGAHAPKDVSATNDLERFHTGELSLDEYMDTRVEKAVAHLTAVVPPEQLELLKEQLKDQFKSDPNLQALLQRATGVVASEAEVDDNG